MQSLFRSRAFSFKPPTSICRRELAKAQLFFSNKVRPLTSFIHPLLSFVKCPARMEITVLLYWKSWE